ncbi:hypothetical protein I302_104256 [Kwoniella bestiolae CBS 10118]|uniref:Zn(2)-C6 fungal-type domain-containing protein n=1 Tax=Kwoniella bestiolae CBS 10118 TaxID=1296100 RepID=A0A1B9GAR2_9TREE|nr:hypothetical protein I302_02964 [Kwoniella bestiolae CBS 10118]OCF28113.1 hypothetical protein I302_02964 [Kwoniella bestiolae CBS 10118]
MGGDHKCPLCSATFTRPQHVGRHLRAHTGDRPYECKECPLRFARSDLLSRHVNKAHKPPDENAAQDKKQNKKGRRKSFPASAMKKPTGVPSINGDNSGSNNANQAREKPRSASFNQQPQPQLQAQRMYPHHPLLAGGSNENGIIDVQPQHQTWSANPSQAFATTAGMTNLSSSPHAQTFVNPVTGTGNPNAILGNPLYPNSSNNNLLPTFDPPFTAAPMKITGSEQGYSSVGQVPINNNSGVLYEWGFKKRACDQCNHSKVRCDFADPCLRCTHRNIKCSYNKPQRSRTIGYPLVPSQASTSSQAGLNHHHQAHNPVSTSPQSQFSSPHSNSSPVAPARAANHHQRNNSVSSLPGNLSVPTSTIPSRQWGSVSQIQPSGPLNNWQPVQSNLTQPMYPNIPAGTAPGSITGQMLPSPVSTNFPMQGATSYQASTLYPGATNAGSRGASPQQGAASTPSLTNNTTSPPDIDEPFERRSSYTGTTGGFLSGQEWQDQNQQFKAPTLQTHNSDPAYIVPFNSSPVTYSPTQTNQLSSSAPFSSEYTYQWPSQSSQTVDPTWQARHGTISDDENASALSSSAHSTFLNLDDAQFAPSQHQQHRRRSSAGQWATAMAQMTLQDSLSSTESSIIPLPEPFSGSGSMDSSLSMSLSSDGSAPTQQTAARRPTFPTLTGVTEEPDAETQLMPSLSDVKDLWRLFMTEPMTGLTPMGEKHNDLEFTANNAPSITPRPGMGKRTLSKSNSMPDLQSPMINGPQFFNTFLSGLTPKPVDPQNSYLPNHHPAGNDGSGSSNDADISKWSKEIQQRQSSFSLSGQPSTKLLGKTTSQSSMAPPSTASNGNGEKPKMNRPLPSVVQRSSALEQTLAPERIPSFGIPQSLLDGNNQFVPQPQTQTQKKMLSGVPPHMARPGNKRLASQTLVPGDNGKKTSFTLYDEPEQVSIPHQTQPQVQTQPQTQNSSMFYPNWSLNPQQAGK